MNLNQITVPSQDLYVSVAFYQALGLRLIVDALPDYARFECPTGEATFSIHHTDAAPKGEGPIIYFECENLNETVENLIKDGVAFDSLPQDKPWLWLEARLIDPDGNHLILYSAGTNRKYPPWRIRE